MAIGSFTIKYTHDDRGQKILFRSMRELGKQAALDPQAATIMDRATSLHLSRMPQTAIILASIANMLVVTILVFRSHLAWAVFWIVAFVILFVVVLYCILKLMISWVVFSHFAMGSAYLDKLMGAASTLYNHA